MRLRKKKTHIIASNRVYTGDVVRFKRVLVCLFIFWHLLSEKFWCSWCASDFQSSMNKALGISFTLRIISVFALSEMSLSIEPLCLVFYSKPLTNFYQTSFHKHQRQGFFVRKYLSTLWTIMCCIFVTVDSACIYWFIPSFDV